MVSAKRKRVQCGPLLGLISGLLAGAAPVNASVNVVTVSPAVQLAQEAPVEITDIRLESSTNGGLVISLNGDGLQTPVAQTSDNTLIATFDNAMLVANFEQANITDAIASVQANSLPNNQVEILITGVDGPPTVSFATTATGLALSVEPGATQLANEPLRLLVTATRTEEDSQSVPRSVTVITREDIAEQTQVTDDLGAILSQFVPGLAPTTGTLSDFGQSLRGRNLFVLIDGIPQAAARDGFRNLRTIDPAAIERIEVVQGPTAIYGDGATGGVVNIITRSAPTEEGFEWESRVGFTAAPSNFDASFGGNVLQYVGGRDGNVDFAFTASYRETGGFFDGAGSRIPPDVNGQGGLSEADTLNLLGKIGINLDDNQRLQLTLNHFQTEQETDFSFDPATLNIAGRQRARALEGASLDTPQRTLNTVVNLTYDHDAVFGGEFSSQLYYRDYKTRFFPFLGDIIGLPTAVFQSEIDSQQFGGRLQFDTPLFDEERFLLTWGADYRQERTSQPLNVFDRIAFLLGNTLVFNQTGEAVWVPPFQQRTLGLFAQANWEVSDQFRVIGGVRHERIGVNVDDFTTLVAGANIIGGELAYNETLFNIGGVFDITDNVNVFANFAQGFSLADVGRVLRDSPVSLPVESLRPEGQRIDHYEIGIRGEWASIQASLAGFYNWSDLGTTFGNNLEIIRAPEQVYGVEATVNALLNDDWSLGGTFTWQDGATDTNLDGTFSPLTGARIAPIKITAYVENQTTPGWRNRLQTLFSGSRDRTTELNEESISSYITFDYISSVDLWGGTLEIGVRNLLDTDYFPIISQLQTEASDIRYSAAEGRTITIGYTYRW